MKPACIKLLALGLASLLSLTAGPAAKGASTGVQDIRVGLYDNRPKVYRNDRGQASGLFIELLQAMAERENWRLIFVDCVWSDCLSRLETGALDLMPDVALTDARNLRFDFHNLAVTHSWSGIWARPELKIFALPDLNGLRIAILQESVQQNALRNMMAGSELSYTPVVISSLAEGFEKVVAGEADAVVSNSYFGGINGPRYQLRETPVVFNPASLYYAAPKGRHGALLTRIDQYLEDWRMDAESPYYTALKRAMVRPRETVIPDSLRWVLAAATVIVLLLLVMSALLRRQVSRRTSQLSRINQRFDHMLKTSPVVLYQLGVHPGGIEPLWISENVHRLFGYKPRQIFERDWWRETVHPDDLNAVQAGFELIQQQRHMVQEYRIIDAAGQVRHIRNEMQYLPETPGQAAEIVGSWSDLTEAHEQADNLRYLTNYDQLTGLPNRLLLRERLQDAIQLARENRQAIALLHIDLDRFKHINETLGYAVGDRLLGLATERMKQVLHVDDTLARIGGDEFVMVLTDDINARTVADMARRLLKLFVTPLVIDDHELVVTLSIGISLYPDDGQDSETLLRHAEIALNAAKEQGRNCLHFFSSTLTEGIRERLLLENALRYAVERGELVLHYQPQLALDSGALVGVEALVRWNHASLGLLPPGRFIPLAEQTGLIGEIGLWVLQEACRQMVAWDRQGFSVPLMAVNLAVQQIEGGRLARQVQEALDKAGLAGHRLELEVTESTIMREPEKATEAMAGFRRLGVKLAIDDFGTGYSSLAYLKRLPLDRIKIDRSFVMDIGVAAGGEAICRTIIHLANSLGLETVAEGVEHAGQAEFLQSEGCDVVQGYLYSRPLPANEVVAQWQTPAADPGSLHNG